jgi:hypothetical protein
MIGYDFPALAYHVDNYFKSFKVETKYKRYLLERLRSLENQYEYKFIIKIG